MAGLLDNCLPGNRRLTAGAETATSGGGVRIVASSGVTSRDTKTATHSRARLSTADAANCDSATGKVRGSTRALGLVVNILVLWTSLYMDRVLTKFRARGVTVNDEDVEQPIPFGLDSVQLPGPLPLCVA